jgi:hypothetical protein
MERYQSTKTGCRKGTKCIKKATLCFFVSRLENYAERRMTHAIFYVSFLQLNIIHTCLNIFFQG